MDVPRAAAIAFTALLPLQGAEVSFRADLYRILHIIDGPEVFPGAVRVEVGAGEEELDCEVVVRPFLPASSAPALPTRLRLRVAPKTARRVDIPFCWAGMPAQAVRRLQARLRFTSVWKVRAFRGMGHSVLASLRLGGRVHRRVDLTGPPLLIKSAFWPPNDAYAQWIAGPDLVLVPGQLDRASWNPFSRPSSPLRFPRTWEAYGLGGMLCLKEGELASMEPEEWAAFWKWITAGGRAAVAYDGGTYPAFPAPFPFKLGPPEEVADADGRNERLRRTVDCPVGWPAHREQQGILWAVARVGFGFLGYVAENPRDRSSTLPADLKALAREMIVFPPPRLVGKDPSRRSASEPEGGLFSGLADGSVALPLDTLLAYLAAVFLILGPGQAAALWLLRRRPWTWRVNALLVAGLACVAVIGANRLRPGRLGLDSMWVAGIFRDSPYIAGIADTRLLSDGNRRYSIAFPADSLPACVEVLERNQSDACLVPGRRPRIENLFVPVLTRARFVTRWVAPKPPGFRVVLRTSSPGPPRLRIEKPAGMSLGPGRLLVWDRVCPTPAVHPGPGAEIVAGPSTEESTIELPGAVLERGFVGSRRAWVALHADLVTTLPLPDRPMYVVPVREGAERLFRAEVERLSAREETIGVLIIECEEES